MLKEQSIELKNTVLQLPYEAPCPKGCTQVKFYVIYCFFTFTLQHAEWPVHLEDKKKLCEFSFITQKISKI